MSILSKVDSLKFKKALKCGNIKALRKIPKTDLHAHSYLSADFHTHKKVTPSMGKPPKNFGSLGAFLQWLAKNPMRPQSIAAYGTVISNVFERMINDSIVFAEVSFDPKDCLALNLSVTEWTELLKKIYAPYEKKIKIGFEFGMNRNEDTKDLLKYIDEIIDGGFFKIIDLYGDELLKPIEEYVGLYKIAKSAKLKLKAHIGEVGSAGDVKKAVELLNLDAIQHGISVVNDKGVMRFLHERGTILNVCPSSNVSLGICESYSLHPSRILFDNGVKFTINTDDYLFFSSDVSEEVKTLYDEGVFSENELLEIVNCGLSQQISSTG